MFFWRVVNCYLRPNPAIAFHMSASHIKFVYRAPVLDSESPLPTKSTFAHEPFASELHLGITAWGFIVLSSTCFSLRFLRVLFILYFMSCVGLTEPCGTSAPAADTLILGLSRFYQLDAEVSLAISVFRQLPVH